MSEVIMVGGAGSAVLDLVFLHGLDGDARRSWTGRDGVSFWPGWLVEDFPGVAVWSIGYEAWSSGWRGRSMPMQDRAINLMASLQNHGIGQRPLCFVTHSMGGLLAKEILLLSAEASGDLAVFASAARGVVFLGTPHTGSGLTGMVNALGVLYRGTAAVRDLRRNSAHLRQLNDRYRDWVDGSRINNLVFFEAHPTKKVWVKVRVVDAASANPGLAGVRPIPVDADHIDMCKPDSRDTPVYGQVRLFVDGILHRLITPPPDTSAGVTSALRNGAEASVTSEPPNSAHGAAPGTTALTATPTAFGDDYPRASGDFQHTTNAEELRRLAADAPISVLVGPRGAGKTQLAASYLRECRDANWPVVIWVNAQSEEDLLAGLAQAAERLEVAVPGHDARASARYLRDALEVRSAQALLVLDNATSPDMVNPLLPDRGATRVLITTTNTAFARTQRWSSLKITGFTEGEAVSYLQARSGVRDAAGALLVAEELGGLPLALAQAGSRIRDYGGYREYLDLLRQVDVTKILGRLEGDDYEHSTAAAILLSVDAVEASAPLCAPLLRLLAFLGTPALGRRHLDTVLADDPASRVSVLQAIERAVQGSVIDWSEDHQALTMHRLIARVLRERERQQERVAEAAEFVVSALERLTFPEEEARARRELGHEIGSHIEAASARLDEFTTFGPDLRLRGGELQAWAASYFQKTRATPRAIRIGTAALSNLKATLGVSNDKVWRCRETLGWSHMQAGQQTQGIQLLRETVKAMQQTLGPDAPEVLERRKNLAGSYRDAGYLEESIREAKAVAEDGERVFGASNPFSLSAKSVLAYTLMHAGRQDESIEVYRDVLDSRRAVLGPHHDKTRWSISTLADAYKTAGRNHEALELFCQVLDDLQQRAIPRDHPDIVAAQHNLAHAYLACGQEDDALELFEQVLHKCQATLHWADHDLIKSQIDLAYAYERRYRYDLAAEQWELLLAARERTLGDDHPDTAWARSRLSKARTAFTARGHDADG